MAKVLILDYEKCNGCNECEKACALFHEGVDNPARSRIRVIKREAEEAFIPVTCQQCKNAPCLEGCPVKAISRDPELNRVMVNQDICIGCKTCVTICPFGAMSFNTMTQQVMKCDFCDGDPECVKVCEPRAIRYADVIEQSIYKQLTIADKYFSFYKPKTTEVST
ncbi:MAG: 4Fe-4S dicluster domain-containing protein [Dehalococcoidales bacterium]|nr:4Fe-4S dicluster domain-containing protein [Dehalococcoidales bacterium]